MFSISEEGSYQYCWGVDIVEKEGVEIEKSSMEIYTLPYVK